MYKVTNQINNVLSFINYKNYLFYVDRTKNLFQNNTLINCNVDASCYDYINGKITYVKDENTFINDIKVIDKTYVRNSKNLNTNTIILDSDYNSLIEGFECKYYLYNIINNDISYIAIFKNLRNILNIDDILFLGSKTTLHAYTLPTAEPLWQFDLGKLSPFQKHKRTPEEPLEVDRFIGVLHNLLWVALNHYTLIAIDVQTGELIHQLSHIPGFDYSYGPVIPEPMAMHIDHKRNKLVALAWEYYWEVDPQTGEINMHDLTNYFRTLHLRNFGPLHTVFLEDEGLMFFVCITLDNVLHYTESQVACFDIQTQKVVWQYKFQPNEQGKIPQPNDLQGNNQKLAVLDMDNTLYIFEKKQ